MSEASIFRHVADFAAATPSGGLGLGALEAQYEELFAEVLEDGVITSDERNRLVQAAKNLGLDPARLERLEEAMTAAYETHHRVRIEDASRARSASLTPLAPPVAAPLVRPLGDDPTLLELRAENERLTRRVAELEEQLEELRSAQQVEVDLG
ncbi:MAG TPA: hypothetical protein VLC09_17555, partial [Polyangiaceae bacterium]|nr:hypothetical protein [Polyangiaceae bacterium]